MITHLVFFRMKAEPSAQNAAENAAELVRQLQELPGKIPQLQDLEAGTDFSSTPASYDVGLYTRFATREDLATYRDHPAHQKVVAFVKEVTSERAVVDFET